MKHRFLMTAALALLAPLAACDKTITHTIVFTGSGTARTPIKLGKIYECDHTCYVGMNHRHAAECGSRVCPKLDKDGSLKEPAAPGSAGCPDEKTAAIGITTQLKATTQSVTEAVNSCQTNSSIDFSGKAGQQVDASGELDAGKKGKVKVGLERDLSAQLNAKWSQVKEEKIRNATQSAVEQILALFINVGGGSMGCGQKYALGLDVTLVIVCTLNASAVVTSTVDSSGNTSNTSVDFKSFDVTVTVGLEGPGLVPERKETSCNCKPFETSTPRTTDDGKNRTGCHRPWHSMEGGAYLFTPDGGLRFGAMAEVNIQAETLEGFTASEGVFVRPDEDGETLKSVVLVTTAAGGGLATYLLRADPAKSGSLPNTASLPGELKQISGDTLAYQVPRSEKALNYSFDRVPATKLGTIGGKEILAAPIRDVRKVDAIRGVDPKTGEEKYREETSTVSMEFQPKKSYSKGDRLAGTHTVHASRRAEKEYEFDLVLNSPGFSPAIGQIPNVRPNVPIDLSKCGMKATSNGPQNISASLKARKK